MLIDFSDRLNINVYRLGSVYLRLLEVSTRIYLSLSLSLNQWQGQGSLCSQS